MSVLKSAPRLPRAEGSPLSRRPFLVTRAVSLVNGARRQEHYDFSGRLVRVEEPDGACLDFAYEEDGSLARVEDSSGAWLEFRRDLQNRELRTLTPRSETIFRASPEGWPAAIIQRVDGYEWTSHYRYDSWGRLTGLLYPQSPHWLELTRTPGGDGRQLRLDISAQGLSYLRADSDATAGRTIIHFATGAVSLEEFSPGRPPRLRRLGHGEALDRLDLDFPFTLDGQGRIIQAGDERFVYDDRGRLTAVSAPGRERLFGYDDQGRLLEGGAAGSHRRFGYADGPALRHLVELDGQPISFTYDALGRRSARQAPEGVTRYTYNLLGLLETVTLPDGAVIRYLYDALGRLVARETKDGITYYLVGVDGARLAVADATGQITNSYLWAGLSCLGRLNGPMGEPLAQTFHRGPGGRLVATGDARGRLLPVSASDPYGADTPIRPESPGFAGLFGDCATGLLWAGSRWYDPGAVQFLTPDTWLNAFSWPQMPGPWRHWLAACPGGRGRELQTQDAYTWCAHDPVNFLDLNGHNWLGLIWSILSTFLWEMQLTSVALEMEAINLVADLIQVFPVFRPVWDKDGYWETSFFNLALPKASYRLMVPAALFLNGVMRLLPRIVHGAELWTLGNVVWAAGSHLRDLEKAGARDLLICSNATNYLAATQVMAAEVNQVPSPNAYGQGDVNAAGDQLTGVTLAAPTGQPLDKVLNNSITYLGVALPGTDRKDVKNIKKVTPPGTIDFYDPLPEEYRGKKVDIHRLDIPLVRITKDAKDLARSITFIRGQAIHFGTALPKDFPTEGLTVNEYFPAGVPQQRQITSNDEYYLIRLAAAADQSLFNTGDLLRLRSGQNYFIRKVARRRGSTDLLLEEPLPKPTPPDTYASIEAVKLKESGTAAEKQDALVTTLDRVGAGTQTDLRRYDALAVENSGGTSVTVERRLVTDLFLSCPINSVPAELSGVDLVAELLVEDITSKAAGTIKSASEITTQAGQAGKFAKDQTVRLATATGKDEALAVVKEVDAPGNRLVLTADQTTISAGTAVNVTLLRVTRSLTPDQLPSPTFPVVVKVDLPTEVGDKALLRLRKKTGEGPVAVRRVTAAPTVLAKLDNKLPNSHAANLKVQRLAPQPDTLRDHATAPKVQMRFSIDTTTIIPPPPPANPYQAGDLLLLYALFASGVEETIREVDRIDALDFYLKDPVEYLLEKKDLGAKVVAATGTKTPDAHLDEALVLIPSDMDVEPITRRQALEQHEMRHVWQGALWGPFLASMPVPWLINLGWPTDKTAHSVSKFLGYFSGFGLDALMAALFWGIGGAHSPTDLQGTLADQDRKVIAFAANANPDQVAAFSPGSPVEVVKGDVSVYNTVDSLDAAQKRLTLRFDLDPEKFAANDQVSISVSAFEKIRKTVNNWFSPNILGLWGDHLPDDWNHILGGFFNRQNWFPFLGFYPLADLISGFQPFRIAFEQDASYHSGELYNSISLAQPQDIYVGQFTRVFAFLQPRLGGIPREVSGIFPHEMLQFLRVSLPKKDTSNPADPGPATTDVAGGLYADAVSIDIGGTRTFVQTVRFREDYYIPLGDRVENAVGAFFAASRPGTYIVRAIDPGGSPDFPVGTSVVFNFLPLTNADFLDTRQIQVKPLRVAPAVTTKAPLFETEEVLFQITGDASAEYKLRYRGKPPTPAGDIQGLRFTAPVLPAGSAQVTHELEITATYPAKHPIFTGPGQAGAARLTESERTNLCQRLTLFINPLTAPTLNQVKAGSTTKFQVDIPPKEAKVITLKVAGSTVDARVLPGEGRPATYTFLAPDRVTASTNVTFNLTFGRRDPFKKVIPVIVQVNP